MKKFLLLSLVLLLTTIPMARAQETACTAEAKLCPDGSSVGRSGPHCEFTPCPGEQGGNREVEPTRCPPEVTTCPDGSTVPRTGSLCEFAPCPAGSSEVVAEPPVKIKGIATQGPTCPVSQPDSTGEDRCKDKFYEGVLIVKEGPTGREVVRLTTDALGRFEANLVPGAYTIVSPEEQTFPRCNADVKIKTGPVAEVAVKCDTGIR